MKYPKIPIFFLAAAMSTSTLVVAEIDGTEYKSTTILPPETTVWMVPEEFIESAVAEETNEIKFETLVRVETGDYEDNDGEEIDSRPGNKWP